VPYLEQERMAARHATIHSSENAGEETAERATDQDQHEWSGKTKRRAEPGRLLPFMDTNPSDIS